MVLYAPSSRSRSRLLPGKNSAGTSCHRSCRASSMSSGMDTCFVSASWHATLCRTFTPSSNRAHFRGISRNLRSSRSLSSETMWESKSQSTVYAQRSEFKTLSERVSSLMMVIAMDTSTVRVSDSKTELVGGCPMQHYSVSSLRARTSSQTTKQPAEPVNHREFQQFIMRKVERKETPLGDAARNPRGIRRGTVSTAKLLRSVLQV